MNVWSLLTDEKLGMNWPRTEYDWWLTKITPAHHMGDRRLTCKTSKHIKVKHAMFLIMNKIG